MGSLFFRKCLAWLAVAFFLLLLPTFGHANIALTGKSFQAILQNETILGYELTKNYNAGYNPYNPGGGSLYNYTGKPLYYDPYKPEVVRTLQAVDDAPIKYPSKVKVADLVGMKDVNGKKIFTVPQSGVYTGMTAASGIAKKALTGLPSFMLMELVFPETLSDGTIKSSGYEFGKISDAADQEITAAEMAARIAQNHGIETSSAIYHPNWIYHPNYADSLINSYGLMKYPPLVDDYFFWDGFPYKIITLWTVTTAIPRTGITQGSGYWGFGNGTTQQIRVTATRITTDLHLIPDPISNIPFDPSNYPELYSGSQGTFNALADLVANDAEIELIPLDPALMPTYFPDTDTGFMRFSGRTEIGGDDYLLGPDYTAVLNPPGVTWRNGFPYVDPASIGLISDPSAPGGQITIIPGSIAGIPAGSKILSVDPQTGLIKFQTPEGSESSKYGTTEEVQNLQTKVASPYLDVNGVPMTFGSDPNALPGQTTGTNSTTTSKVITEKEDYSVSIPGLPGLPSFPHEFDVPEPERWPWETWVANPIKTILDNMQITAAGSPYLNFPINFSWYPAFTLTIDFSEYETEISTIGGYMVTLAYIMAVLFVVRAKN